MARPGGSDVDEKLYPPRECNPPLAESRNPGCDVQLPEVAAYPSPTVPFGGLPEVMASFAMLIPPEVPATDAVIVSVAVMVWLPVVFRVAEKLPVPFVRDEFAGSDAIASVLVK